MNEIPRPTRENTPTSGLSASLVFNFALLGRHSGGGGVIVGNFARNHIPGGRFAGLFVDASSGKEKAAAS